MSLRDTFDRPLGSLRVSVTDRCNLRCAYCMPEAEYLWLPRSDLLTFEEIDRLAGVFVGHGVDRLRLTGGEPLLRRDLPALVTRLAGHAGVRDLALTTNGILLAAHVQPLRDAGLGRVTVSLDTLHRDRFMALARFDAIDAVMAGIAAARDVFGALKIDTVVMRGVNDDELVAMIDFGRRMHAEVRFIEYMDVGGATRWTPAAVVSRAEILARLGDALGAIEPVVEESAAPADRYRLADGTVFGIISSTTQPFCGTCDRARLTADGQLLLCLYATAGLDLRGPLRRGATDEDIGELVTAHWTARTDRGAERRLALADRGAFVSMDALRAEPHLEMHTRGG